MKQLLTLLYQAWQKRGHDSLNGVVTIIQNDVGQCIDYRVLSKKCNACSKWETKKDTVEFENLFHSMNVPLIIQHQPGQSKQKVWLNVFNCH